MINTTGNKKPGLVFYMQEGHNLKPFDTEAIQAAIANPPSEELREVFNKFSLIAQRIMATEIALGDKFTHWGITVDKLDSFLIKNGFGLIFFTRNALSGAVFPGFVHNEKIESFDQEDYFLTFINKVEALVETYDPIKKVFKKI